MARTIRFHLDENCPHAIAEGLRRRGIEVTTTPEADLLSASDEEQTAYARSEGRVIFTLDKDFLRINSVRHSPRRYRLLPSGQVQKSPITSPPARVVKACQTPGGGTSR